MVNLVFRFCLMFFLSTILGGCRINIKLDPNHFAGLNLDDAFATTDETREISTNPAVFLSGTYTLSRLLNGQQDITLLSPQYLVGVVNQEATYTMSLTRVGKDSLLMELDGKGRAGTYNHYSVGTFGTRTSPSNPQVGSGSRTYTYSLSSAGNNNVLTISRITDGLSKTNYSTHLSLYQTTGGNATNVFKVYADGSGPGMLMLSAVLGFERKSTGVPPL